MPVSAFLRQIPLPAEDFTPLSPVCRHIFEKYFVKSVNFMLSRSVFYYIIFNGGLWGLSHGPLSIRKEWNNYELFSP